MRNTIAVMNTKGGVGKSTLVLAIAETLSAKFGKNVLIIDSDAQASVSLMLLSAGDLNRLQLDRLTIVDLLVASVLNNMAIDWTRFAVAGVSDVEEARTVYLIPSDMQLTLFEREVAKERLLARMRASVGTLLADVRHVVDQDDQGAAVRPLFDLVPLANFLLRLVQRCGSPARGRLRLDHRSDPGAQ